ncbi:hypothetical protein CTI12_AA466430 [Artemisia annua]|uniref:Uncharacterized protein n=1 Tax=Artemisia annua TaxID=35608 RepID=A0A2U1LQ57_ARTAN|nr:hypothetical protein CTI12_AA466430 [Artemisia annua]
MVLDHECVVKLDLDNFVMGEVKDFSSINNLSVLLSNEGFQQVNLAYLGGLWVMIELASVKTKMRFMKHVGIASWFNQLCNAQPDFVSRERIVWIDIEGVPLHAWSRPTFTKIGSRWGEVIELEDDKEDCFARKRICIKTKHEDNILEKFKIIVRGKVFVLRAKELFIWSPTFIVNKDVEYCSEDESVKGAEENNADTSKQVNMDDDSDVDGVSETYFGDQVDSSGHDQPQNLSPKEKEISSDPFNLYDLLNKHGKDEAKSGLDSSIPFPPGFTPDNKEVQEAQGKATKIFIFIISVIAITGLVVGFGFIRHHTHPKSHQCSSGDDCLFSGYSPPTPPSAQLPFPSLPNPSNPSDQTTSPPSPPQPPETAQSPPAPPSENSQPPPAPENPQSPPAPPSETSVPPPPPPDTLVSSPPPPSDSSLLPPPPTPAISDQSPPPPDSEVTAPPPSPPVEVPPGPTNSS